MPLVEEPSAFDAGQSSCELTSIAVNSCSSFSNGSVAAKKGAISDGDDLYNAARNIGTVMPCLVMKLNLNESTRAACSCGPRQSRKRRARLERSPVAIQEIYSTERPLTPFGELPGRSYRTHMEVDRVSQDLTPTFRACRRARFPR